MNKILKWTKDLKTHLTEDTQMANEPVRRFTTSHVIRRKMQTAVSYP